MSDGAKIALVTGANRGLGLEVVRQLARRGMVVILGARDRTKGQRAAQSLIDAGLAVVPRRLDVTEQIKSFESKFQKLEEALHIKL